MKTVKINLEDFKPHQKIRIEFLKEIEFRIVLSFFIALLFPILGFIVGFNQKQGGGDFLDPFLIISTMGFGIAVIIFCVSITQKTEIYSLFIPYNNIDQTYKWVIYDYEKQELIFSNQRKKTSDLEVNHWIKHLLYPFQTAQYFLWKKTNKITKKKNGIIDFIDEILLIPYFCVLWPLVLNPMQLAFLEYDKLKKYHRIPKGAKILVLGAGAIPHHIRYKKSIGKDGKIVVSDNHRPTLYMSKAIETIYEFVFSLFGVKRPKVEYKIVDSTDTFPFEENTFDIIVGIRNYYVDYDECKRVLRDEGIIYLTNLGYWFATKPPEEKVKRFDTNAATEYQLVSVS